LAQVPYELTRIGAASVPLPSGSWFAYERFAGTEQDFVSGCKPVNVYLLEGLPRGIRARSLTFSLPFEESM
jgi:hypothetical protein